MNIPHVPPESKPLTPDEIRALPLYNRVLDAVIGLLLASNHVTLAEVREHMRMGDVFLRVIDDLLAAGIIRENTYARRKREWFANVDKDDLLTSWYALNRLPVEKSAEKGGAR